MGAGVLVAGDIGFNRVPTEQRECLVEVGGTGEVGDQPVRQAAVAVSDGDVGEWNSRLVGLRDAILVVVDEGAGVDVRLPLGRCDVSHSDGLSAASYAHRCRKSVYQQIVPLIEYGDSPIARGKTREFEGAIAGALGECEVFAVGIAKAHIALGPVVCVVRTAAVEPLVGSAAQALSGDFAGDCVVAIVSRAGLRTIGVCAVANVRLAGIDDRRIGETNTDVVRRRPELLEVGWLADSDESVLRLLAVQGVGLEPLFAPGNAVSTWDGNRLISSGHQVGDDRLARKWRQRCSV